DTSDLAPLYKALESDPHSEYGALPFAKDRNGVRFAMPEGVRRFLKGTLDLLAGVKTGQLTPDAMGSFTTIAGGAGRLFGPRGGAETLAAGGKRKVGRAISDNADRIAAAESEKHIRALQLAKNI